MWRFALQVSFGEFGCVFVGYFYVAALDSHTLEQLCCVLFVLEFASHSRTGLLFLLIELISEGVIVRLIWGKKRELWLCAFP